MAKAILTTAVATVHIETRDLAIQAAINRIIARHKVASIAAFRVSKARNVPVYTVTITYYLCPEEGGEHGV